MTATQTKAKALGLRNVRAYLATLLLMGPDYRMGTLTMPCCSAFYMPNVLTRRCAKRGALLCQIDNSFLVYAPRRTHSRHSPSSATPLDGGRPSAAVNSDPAVGRRDSSRLG